MALRDQREKLLAEIDKNKEARLRYDERPFKKQYDEFEERITEKIKNIVAGPNVKTPIQITVPDVDFRLIWMEVNALNRLLGKDQTAYDVNAKYSIYGVAIVRLHHDDKDKVKEEAMRILSKYNKMLKFQSPQLVRECTLNDIDNTIYALQKGDWGIETERQDKEIQFYEAVKDHIYNRG